VPLSKRHGWLDAPSVALFLPTMSKVGFPRTLVSSNSSIAPVHRVQEYPYI
jgi:hypothetical protein